METKQIAIEFLIETANKSKRKKQKAMVIKDIKLIEKLELCVGDNDNYYKRLIYIGNEKCYLLYNKEKGKENNYIGEMNLATQDYSILYKILVKYNAIKYYADTDLN